jgi:flagellin
MSLSILDNVSSLAAQSLLSMTQASLQKTLLQLSSGSRLNGCG